MDLFGLDSTIKWTAKSTATNSSLPSVQKWFPPPQYPVIFPVFAADAVEAEFERFVSCGNVRLQAALAQIGVGCGLVAAIALAIASGAGTDKEDIPIEALTGTAAALLLAAGTLELIFCVLKSATEVAEQHFRRRLHGGLQLTWLVASVLVSIGASLDGLTCTRAAGEFSSTDACNQSVNAGLVIGAACLSVCVTSSSSCMIQLGIVFIASSVSTTIETRNQTAWWSATLRIVLLLATFVMLAAMNIRRDAAAREHFIQIVQVECLHQVLASHRERVITIVKAAMPEAIARRIGSDDRSDGSTVDVCDHAIVCATGIANFGAHTTTHFMQDIVNTFHKLYTLLDEAVELFGVDFGTASGDTYVVTSGLLRGSTPRAERCVRFALWQIRYGDDANLSLHGVVIQGPVVGGVIGNRRYAIGGKAVDNAVALLSSVPASQVKVDANVRSACSAELEFTACTGPMPSRWYRATPGRLGAANAALETFQPAASPALDGASAEQIARAALALVASTATDMSAAQRTAHDAVTTKMNYCVGRFEDEQQEDDYFLWACQRTSSGFASLELATGAFLLVVAIVATIDLGLGLNDRDSGAIGAVVLFYISAVAALVFGFLLRYDVFELPKSPTHSQAIAMCFHTAVLASSLISLFFSGRTIVSVDPHFLFLALMPDAMLSLCTPLSAVSATLYALLVLMVPIVASGISQYGYGVDEVILVIYITFVTVVLGQYGPFTTRRQFFTFKQSEETLKYVQTSTRTLVDLVSRLVPTHVVDLGVQLVTEGRTVLQAEITEPFGDLSAVGKLLSLQSTRLPVEVTHTYSELVTLALRLDSTPGNTTPLTEAQLISRFKRQWSFVSAMILCEGGLQTLELLHAVGDTLLFAGPFAQESRTPALTGAEVVNFLHHLAFEAAKQGVGFTAACAVEEAIGAFVGNSALRYLVFGPAATQAEELLRAVPFDVNAPRGVAFATRAFKAMLEPDYGFDVLHRMVPLPTGQLAFFPPGSLQPALASMFGRRQRWRVSFMGVREVWPILLTPEERAMSNFMPQLAPQQQQQASTGLIDVLPAHDETYPPQQQQQQRNEPFFCSR